MADIRQTTVRHKTMVITGVKFSLWEGCASNEDFFSVFNDLLNCLMATEVPAG